MGSIRKQTIVSSLLVYIGFGIGALNTWLYTKKNFLFTPDQYALTGLFSNVAQLFFCFASLNALSVAYKFYPYYKDNLPDKQNDLFTRTLIMVLSGSVLVAVAGYIFQPVIVRKFSENSKLFVDYYHWVLIFGFGYTLFGLFEVYCWILQKTILSNFLRETGLRMATTMLILLYYFKVVTFQHFVFLFSTLYFIMAAVLGIYFLRHREFYITFKVSRVTKKFRKKMLQMQALLFGGTTIIIIGQTLDGIIIASLKGLVQTGIYTFAGYAANLVQVPQRSIQAASTGILVRAWKDKNYAEINRIYHRSTINMLLLGLFIFGNIWLNVAAGLKVLNIQADFSNALQAILIIGLTRVIDAGTGLNQTVIITSNKWKFEFFTGVIMLAIRLPLSYILVKKYGFIGSAYAEMISLTIYNYIRYDFLRRVYKMQPFDLKTLYTVLLSLCAYFITLLSLSRMDGWPGIICRTVVFSGLMIAGTFALKLTPDAMQLYDNFKKRFARG